HGPGGDNGAYASVAAAPGVGAEGLVQYSRFPAQDPGDDWFASRSPFPGGDMTRVAGRLFLRSSRMDCSMSAAVSSPAGADPGSAGCLWVRARSRPADAALLLAVASPGFRGADARCLPDTSEISGALRLGADPRIGVVHATVSRITGRFAFSPQPALPDRVVLKADVARDLPGPFRGPTALLLQAEREISHDASGARECQSRCGVEMRGSLAGCSVQAGAGLSDRDGGDVRAALLLAAGTRLQVTVGAGAEGLGTVPRASTGVTLTIVEGAASGALRAGLEDCPLRGRPAPARYLRVSLVTTLRQVNPTRPPG
ncbi:MAG TPA: hypothetical protein VFI08_09200, partial [Spirochaetia bacterium]|nr:hypothetical protein [Spirochaetia bacterium]